MTPLDMAHGEMAENPDDTALRLRFYERLAGCELFLLLDRDPVGERIEPSIFPLDSGNYVLVFDTEQRLVEFTGKPSPFAAMSGRVVVDMIATKDLGLAVNLGVATSSILLGGDAVSWLHATLKATVNETQEIPTELCAPSGIEKGFIQALDAKIASAIGLADCAYLAGSRYSDGPSALILAITGADPAAHSALMQALGEVVSFSAQDTPLDITFLRADMPVVKQFEKVALRFDFPRPETAQYQPKAPGRDPDKPPKLR